jgi:hypothetical protein
MPSHLIFLFRHMEQAFMCVDLFLELPSFGAGFLPPSSGERDVPSRGIVELVDADKASFEDVAEAIAASRPASLAQWG